MASFSVVNNIGSVNAQSKLYETNIGLSRTLARLSSGLRINQSGDDAAGLAVANKFRSDVAILNVGVRNANDGLSSLQIADGALDNISRLLDRAATLATQSATGTTTSDSRTVLQEEVTAILSEIDREAGIASLTTST
ncbi:MAG: flagellin, partial [Terriglobia bacterium]